MRDQRNGRAASVGAESGTGTAARVAEILAWLALLPGIAVTVLVLGAVSGVAGPFVPILSLIAVLAAALARWRRLPTPIGCAALAAAVVPGAARTVSGLAELFAGF